MAAAADGAARAKMQEGEGKLKGGGFLSFLSGPKYDEASELFQQAANQFKLAKQWTDAAEAFSRCAYCAQKSGSPVEEAQFLVEAGKVTQKVSTADAVPHFERAITIFNANGRFQNSAKLLKQIAETYETERVQYTEAREYYKRAAEMFDMDDHGKSNYSKCMLKVAEYCAKDEQYQEAITIFEQEANKALGNNLLQYGAKEHLLKAGILHLVVGDTVTVNNKVEEYRSLDPRFASSREGELFAGLAEAFNEPDGEKFSDVLFEYDKVTKLDAWKTEFLVKAKEKMSGGAAEELDLT
jgi:alpha-soluble NSF attachment protein